MITGIGTDIVQIPRIERLLDLYGLDFIKKILSEREIQQLVKLNKDKHGCFVAKRFAAKEAVSKALGTGIGRDLKFTDISVMNDDLGKPFIQIFSTKNLDKFKQIKIHISISDDYPIAVAFAIATLYSE